MYPYIPFAFLKYRCSIFVGCSHHEPSPQTLLGRKHSSLRAAVSFFRQCPVCHPVLCSLSRLPFPLLLKASQATLLQKTTILPYPYPTPPHPDHCGVCVQCWNQPAWAGVKLELLRRGQGRASNPTPGLQQKAFVAASLPLLPELLLVKCSFQRQEGAQENAFSKMIKLQIFSPSSASLPLSAPRLSR